MKAHFITGLSVDHLFGKFWKLKSPLIYYSRRYNITIFVPPGFVTDFASVPRVPLAYLFTGNTAHEEAVVHDLGYRWGMLAKNKVDMLFHEAAIVRGNLRPNQSRIARLGRFLRRNLMTGFVFALGWGSYKNYPGSMDYRICKGCIKFSCDDCENYFPGCEDCIVNGHQTSFFGVDYG